MKSIQDITANEWAFVLWAKENHARGLAQKPIMPLSEFSESMKDEDKRRSLITMGDCNERQFGFLLQGAKVTLDKTVQG